MLDEGLIKTIFMHCTHKNPDGIYADEVDVVEYAKAIENYVREVAIKEERDACINMVKTLNVEVAKALADYRRISDKAM